MFSKTQLSAILSTSLYITTTFAASALSASAFAAGTEIDTTSAIAPTPSACDQMTAEAVSIVKKEFGLAAATVIIDAAEVCRQLDPENNPGVATDISLQKAIRESLKSFIGDRRDIESPGALVLALAFEQAGLPWTVPVPAEVAALAESLLKDHLNKPETKITLLNLDEKPENGESVTDHWIVRMKIGTLSDHIFWAVVDRAGEKKTYNYGFN